ncbi:hypothetical protein [Paenibacillus thalictri]|uniref:Uncharacterized protein n=1 Tax=Paenibacillus thalictri TaxID=2527873 RepID=A0A4Q9DPK0_9BACL|nr:hypothetical protein [Paenibacillus thalictri]TBL78210.1 hypothetical protein EYB31_15145 [Paenibacillus thalictri]
MTINWRKTAGSLVISASLLTCGMGVSASDIPEQGMAEEASLSMDVASKYKLNEQLDVEVKSTLNEHVLNGTRIGVVVRVSNKAAQTVRVPDTYELRVKTAEGVEYTLQPSSANSKSIQPKTTQELSYMSVIDRSDNVTLSEINWTDVDVYAYPKAETLMLAIPVGERQWRGGDTLITDKSMLKKWGNTFNILPYISPLEYKPVSINKEITSQGLSYVVQLLVSNPTGGRETVPDFNVDGKTSTKIFSGKRGEPGSIVLEAKEQKYIHYVINTDLDSVLSSLNVLTTETFAQGTGGGPINYSVGRVNIALPGSADLNGSAALPYTLGTPMKFDQISDVIHPEMAVSMIEFRMNDNEGEGSKNITAKFKLTNQSDRPMAVPAFQTDLQSADGFLYSGNRQNVTTQNILPNSSLVVGYSFTLPASETGKGLSIKIQDAATVSPYKSTIAAYSVALQDGLDDKQFSLYPFDVKIDYYTITPYYNRLGNSMTYSYKLRLDMNMKRDPLVQIDSGFSKLQFDAFDTLGRLVGTTQASFLGTGKLTTGENNIYLNGTTEQMEMQLTIKMYEVFTTPAGDSKRLLGEFKR